MKILIISLFVTLASLSIAEPLPTPVPEGHPEIPPAIPDGHPVIPPKGIPQGHPTIQQGIDATAPAPGGNTLTHKGIVISTIQTEHYTYIEVQQGDKNNWLATSKLTLIDGAVIRYSKGIPMANFYSATLKREFPEIFFVGSVEVVK